MRDRVAWGYGRGVERPVHLRDRVVRKGATDPGHRVVNAYDDRDLVRRIRPGDGRLEYEDADGRAGLLLLGWRREAYGDDAQCVEPDHHGDEDDGEDWRDEPERPASEGAGTCITRGPSSGLNPFPADGRDLREPRPVPENQVEYPRPIEGTDPEHRDAQGPLVRQRVERVEAILRYQDDPVREVPEEPEEQDVYLGAVRKSLQGRADQYPDEQE